MVNPKRKTSLLPTVKTISYLSLVLGSLNYIRLEFWSWDSRMFLYAVKMIAGAFAPLSAIFGGIGAVLGFWLRAPFAAAAGLIGAFLSVGYIRQVTAPHKAFDEVFGPDWENSIEKKASPAVSKRLLKERFRLQPVSPILESVIFKDIPFATVPGTDRVLLCDIWQPPTGTPTTGLVIIYLHGGGWQSLDKDSFTRPLFDHLASQGHTIMDVAYRLIHETDLYGITGDVKRAIVWMKENASRYGANPDKIVMMGGSAGGHLALLSAFTPNDPILDPPDLNGKDTSVQGVVSMYGLPDLRELDVIYDDRSNPLLVALGQQLGMVDEAGNIDPPDLTLKLFGSSTNKHPERAAQLSPITHAARHCPPTLLLQGTHDHITRLEDVRALDRALDAAGVISILVELPLAEHGFDLFALPVSPAAQAALYDVERFLLLIL